MRPLVSKVETDGTQAACGLQPLQCTLIGFLLGLICALVTHWVVNSLAACVA